MELNGDRSDVEMEATIKTNINCQAWPPVVCLSFKSLKSVKRAVQRDSTNKSWHFPSTALWRVACYHTTNGTTAVKETQEMFFKK